MKSSTVITLLLPLLIGYGAQHTVVALKCRGRDNGSEAEFRRITRTCMRKMGESTFTAANGHQNAYNSASYNNHNSNNHNNNNRGGQQHQHIGRQHTDGGSDEQFNNQQQSYGYYQDDTLAQRTGNRQSYNNRQTHNRPANANSSDRSGGRANAQNANANGNGSGKSSRNSNHTTGAQENCMAHCFFAELNTLNNDDYPDRQKVMYMLTKDLRDRELRNFYGDTIGECFHYMESQRRRDGKCHYANELVRCMTEYAKANCEDWQDYGNIVFN